ncbi:hypothetical protein V5O48_003684 [Marasmius crinis-equi]|uniref:F-box domain-containing protein n=1 Tax=Marasmius crinis-equi TaxID=585013 RepID=A0ABR3FT52_9AGAR
MTRPNGVAVRHNTCQHCPALFEATISPPPDISPLRSGGVFGEYRMRIEDKMLELDEATLARLENAVAFHETLLRKIKADENLLRKRILDRKAFKAPIRRLPSEILQETLLLACAGEEYHWSDRPIYPIAMFGRRGKNAPNALAQVCFRWHQIVYDTPQFWGALTITVPRSADQQNHLQQILHLSRSLPLKLSIERGTWYGSHVASDYITPLKEALSRTSELHTDYDFIAEENLGGMAEYCNLKRLFLYVRGAYGASQRFQFSRPQLASLIQAPNLDSFWTDSFREVSRHGLFPSSTLTVFECGEGGIVNQEQLQDLFRSCPRIRSLSINLRGSSTPQEAPKPLFSSTLERLTYNCDDSLSIVFIDSLTTPSLKELALPMNTPGNAAKHILEFLDRSNCSLRVLECSLPMEFSSDPSGWSTVLARLPDLEILRVRLSGCVSWSGTSAFDVLCDTLSGDIVILKRMTVLQVIAHGGIWTDLEGAEVERVVKHFLMLAESRSPHRPNSAVVPLRECRLQVESQHSWEPEAPKLSISREVEIRRLQLVSAGMECEVIFPFD